MNLVDFGKITRRADKKWIDSKGKLVHGIYHLKIKDSIHKTVFVHGNKVGSYVYPRILRSFNSPLLNDYNLHFTGGWIWFENQEQENDELLFRVSNNLKTAGFVVSNRDTCVKIEKKAKRAGLVTDLHSNNVRPDELWEVGMSIKGKFGGIFDLPALERDYARWGIYAPITYNFSNVEIASLLKGFDYSNSSKPLQLKIITGLLLGYPLESTCALINKRIL